MTLHKGKCVLSGQNYKKAPPLGRRVRNGPSEWAPLLADTAPVSGHEAWQVKPKLDVALPALGSVFVQGSLYDPTQAHLLPGTQQPDTLSQQGLVL